jgi:hypothetical protein
LKKSLAYTILLLLGSCATTEQADAPEVQSVPAVQYALDDGSVPLQDFYATSVTADQRVSFVQALFDGDSTTYWRTKTGAGPNEGLMLYFAEPTYIKQIHLQQPQLADADKITEVQVYANGRLLTSYNPSSKITVDTEIQSLFIRLVGFEGMKNRSLSQQEVSLSGLSADNEMLEAYVATFPKTSFAAISGIELYGKDNQALQLVPPIMLAATVTASSELSPIPAYGVQQLFDGRRETGWAEGATGTGEGESITFSFSEPQQFTGLQLANGFQRSKEHFYANARPKVLSVTADSLPFVVLAENKMGIQQLEFPHSVTSDKLSLSIDKVQPGTKYNDMVMSELLFKQGKVAIKPVPAQQEIIEKDLTEKAEGTVLQKVLDRNLNIEIGDMDIQRSRSFILRSDYSFVYYDKETLYDNNARAEDQKVADGNWEIKHLATDSAVVRIFGKLASTSRRAEFYVGNTEESGLRIFQDFITITPTQLYGQQFIDTLGLYE